MMLPRGCISWGTGGRPDAMPALRRPYPLAIAARIVVTAAACVLFLSLVDGADFRQVACATWLVLCALGSGLNPHALTVAVVGVEVTGCCPSPLAASA